LIAADEFASQRTFDLAGTVGPTGIDQRTFILADFFAGQRADEPAKTRGLFADLAEPVRAGGSGQDTNGDEPSLLGEHVTFHF
jgi:hypothetical protein